MRQPGTEIDKHSSSFKLKKLDNRTCSFIKNGTKDHLVELFHNFRDFNGGLTQVELFSVILTFIAQEFFGLRFHTREEKNQNPIEKIRHHHFKMHSDVITNLRPYFCRGEVVKGFGRGSKELGIPTG